MQRYILYAPALFCFEEKLKKLGYSRTYIQNHLWKYFYVYTLAVKQLRNDRQESRFFTISMKKLVAELGGQGRIKGIQVRYANHILDELCAWNVIIRQYTNYEVMMAGKPQKRMRVDIKVNDLALEAGYAAWVAPANYRTCRLDAYVPNFDHLNGIYKQIAENNQRIIEFDAAGARAYAWQAYQNQEPLPARRNQDNILVKNRYVDRRVYSFWMAAIDNMEQKCYRPTADNANDKTDRYFWLVAQLPRGMRRFITIGGQQLNEVDISSSQCLVFGIYLKQYYANRGETLPADVEHYISLCEMGQFYQYVQPLVLAPGETLTYDEFKVSFFARVFYSTENCNYKWRTRFAAEFENVSRIITEFKSESYKDLPQKMSHLESEIMLHRITPRLFAEGITDQFSLHDSFFCTASNKARIEQIVVEEFQRYGVTPHLKNKSAQVPTPVEAAPEIEPVPATSEADLFEQALALDNKLDLFEMDALLNPKQLIAAQATEEALFPDSW
jgi:hypothetical protein